MAKTMNSFGVRMEVAGMLFQIRRRLMDISSRRGIVPCESDCLAKAPQVLKEYFQNLKF